MNRKTVIALLTILIIPFCAQARLEGKAKLDSLLNLLPQTKEDTIRVNTLNNISFAYMYIDPMKGIEYGRQGAELARKLEFDRGVAKAVTNIAQNYMGMSILDSALVYSLQALELHEKLGNKRNITIALSTLANAYACQTDLSKALDYHFRALTIREELKDSDLIATSLMNIGNIYVQMGDAKSIKYNLDALKIYEKLGNRNGMSISYLNLGSCYDQQKDYKRALENYSKSILIAREIGQTMHIITAMENIGNTYLQIGDFPLGLKYGFEALHLCKGVGDQEGEVTALATIGKAYLALSKREYTVKLPDSLANIGKSTFLKKSLHYLSTAIAENGGSNLEIHYETLAKIAEAYELSGDSKKALESYKLYTKIKDSLFSENNRVKVAKQETKREADLKEKQVEINRLSKLDSNRKMQLLLVGIGFLSVVTGVTIRSGKRQKVAKERAEKLKGELEETLLQKNHLMEKLSESVHMKSKFFANISHELRTPVTILTGMLDLMKQRKDEGADKNKLEIAFNNSRRLQYMVEEMLDLSKLDKPETTMKYEIKEITPLLKRMVYAFSSYTEQAKISLSFEAVAVEQVFVSTDVEKLEKILTNLIYNAVKFTPENGSIKVTASPSADKKWVSIIVTDTGIGIDEKDLPYIFDRFYQSESSGGKELGSGIGLSLVHELTGLLGGRVEVASKIGVGTTFTLHFPVFNKAIPETQADDEILTGLQAELHFSNRYTILLVEDNAEMRYYIKETLSGNLTLVEVANGREALDWLNSNHADMVITDIMMPEMDGRELINALKTDDKYKKIPIITVSALADEENQLSTLRMGIDDYIIKPFNPTELRIRVRNLLLNLEERNAFGQQVPEPDDIPADSIKAAEFKKKIQDYVLARMKKYDVTVYDVAYEFSLSERQLYRLSKSLTGFTAAQLIKEVKLQKAYELLVNRQVAKVESLAKEVGFENVSYFTKQFAERFGRKPSDFF